MFPSKGPAWGFEGGVHSPLLLGHAPVDGNGWEVLLHKELGQGHAALHRLHKYHHL